MNPESTPPSPYIHGFSPTEQQRLLAQAEILAPGVMQHFDFQPYETVLELGCGVGAEIRILSQRFPQTHFVGIDRSTAHLQAARQVLAEEINRGQVTLHLADAEHLPLADHQADHLVTIWMLEHAPGTEAILREGLRVLKPGGYLHHIEVENGTFGFHPVLPAIAGWWERFNQAQTASGGDPYIGKKLNEWIERAGAICLTAAPFPNIDSVVFPERRAGDLDYLEDLLLSGAETLAGHGISPHEVAALKADFNQARQDPSIQFQYHAWRAVGQKPF